MITLERLSNLISLFPLWTLRSFTSGTFYLGPETIMPLASIIATILGFLLIFWRAIIRFIKRRILHITPNESEDALAQPADDEQDVDG